MKRYWLYITGVAVVGGVIMLMAWRRRAASVAADFIDVEEIGNNQGWTNKVFEQMMKSVGWISGEAWCMYFVKAVYMSAYRGQSDDIDKVLTGSTQSSWDNAKKTNVFKVIDDGTAKPGDIVIWQSLNNSSLGHAAIVWKKSDPDNGTTVEGNSSLQGARDGQGVVKGQRVLVPGAIQGSLRVKGFLRLKNFI